MSAKAALISSRFGLAANFAVKSGMNGIFCFYWEKKSMARTNQSPIAGQNEKTESQSQNSNPQNVGDSNQEVSDSERTNTTPVVETNSTGSENAGKQRSSKNSGGSKNRDNANIEKEFVVNNPAKANKKLCAITGIIEFDKDGNATVGYADADYFSKIEGYSVKEK